MAKRTIAVTDTQMAVEQHDWVRIGFKAALFSIVTVLVIQALALAIWPELALFKPLDSYPRSALFTLVPALGATAVFAWLAKHQDRPVEKFLVIAAVVLLISFIPDYALPLANKSLLASSVAAFMHLVAGIVTVATIVSSYRSKATL